MSIHNLTRAVSPQRANVGAALEASLRGSATKRWIAIADVGRGSGRAASAPLFAQTNTPSVFPRSLTPDNPSSPKLSTTYNLQPTVNMHKIKSLFNKDKDETPQSSSSSSPPVQQRSPPVQQHSAPPPAAAPVSQSAAGGAAGGPTGDDVSGVILHTNIGDITIALYPETPKVCI